MNYLFINGLPINRWPQASRLQSVAEDIEDAEYEEVEQSNTQSNEKNERND